MAQDGLNIEAAIRFANGVRVEAAFTASTQAGRITLLFGPSGSGKTTVLRLLAGLERPCEGRICFNDAVWADTRQGLFLPPQRRGIGFVTQYDSLFPHMDVLENIAYGLGGLSRDDKQAKVRAIARMLQIEELLGRHSRALSGGQAQRVALARALVLNPRCLLLDEPLSALDAPLRVQLGEQIVEWVKLLGIPCFMVTHDRAELDSIGHDVIVMADGRVAQFGNIADVFDQPASERVARILGFGNFLRVEKRVPVGADRHAGYFSGFRLPIHCKSGGNADALQFAIRAEHLRISPDQTFPATHGALPCMIDAVAKSGPLYGITLAAPLSWTVLYSAQLFEQLALSPGQRCWVHWRPEDMKPVGQGDDHHATI